MFDRDSDSLPTHLGNSTPKKSFQIPKISKPVALTYLSGVLSLIIIFLGIHHSRLYSYHYDIYCNKVSCHYHSHDKSTVSYDIPRESLRDIELVRLDAKGNIAEDAMNDEEYGYNVQFKIAENEKQVGNKMMTTYKYQLFQPKDIGKKTAQRSIGQFKRYIQKKIHRAMISEGQNLTFIGVLLIVLGVVLIVLTALFGQYGLPEPKRMKKMS